MEEHKIKNYDRQSDCDIRQQEITKISLLEEKLVVNRNKKKVGEVLVRKQIETRMIQVPLRREVLIIEQVGEVTKQLAAIDLLEEDSNQINSQTLHQEDYDHVILGEYISLETAKKILEQVSLVANSLTSQPKIKLEILVDNPVQQKVYQNLLQTN